jgi:hypothetical protein
MGISTNAYISFGFDIGGGDDAPWRHRCNVPKKDHKFRDGDSKDWYYTCVKKYPPTTQLYDSNGMQLPGTTDEQVNQFFKERREFRDENPLPFELTNTCSGDEPMYILSVPNSGLMCFRGCPEAFSPESLQVNQEDFDKFMLFVQEYFPKLSTVQPKWYLSSYVS